MARIVINQTLADLLPATAIAGKEQLELPARSVRELLQQLELMAPGCARQLRHMAVAIDGHIEPDALLLPLGDAQEVCFVPPIEGG